VAQIDELFEIDGQARCQALSQEDVSCCDWKNPTPCLNRSKAKSKRAYSHILGFRYGVESAAKPRRHVEWRAKPTIGKTRLPLRDTYRMSPSLTA